MGRCRVKNDRDAKQAYGDLVRRRTIVQGLMDQTREGIEMLMEKVKAPDADTRDILALQVLTFRGQVLVRVMTKIADEAAQLALELNRPPIGPFEKIIPDHMPEQL